MLPETAALPSPRAAAAHPGVTIAPIMEPAEARAGLIRVLQHAYSGEQAAAYAYRGHWQSVADPEEAARIRQIEAEEWHHRDLVGGLLRELGAGPNRVREIRTAIIGRTLGALCHLSGWFIPMYAAGKLESRNIVEYEDAARFALGCGAERFLDCLLTMAEVEWEHEQYFRARVLSHPWHRVFKVWPAPPPKASIRGAR
jgi:demethoxyubiquinone hydroxylase (CLK1/Coq7/Cat5 family)